MSPEAVEIDIHIHNDFQLWKQHEAIEATLAKKIVRGIYDPELAVKGWMGLVDRAVRSYAKDNQMSPAAFDRNLRRELATEFERRFYTKHMGMRKRKPSDNIAAFVRSAEKHERAGDNRTGCVFCGSKSHVSDEHDSGDNPPCGKCGSDTHATRAHRDRYEVGEDWL